jgi:hypothetical protein
MTHIPKFNTAEDFFFKTPLYSAFTIDHERAMRLLRRGHRVDGYCPSCGKESTFIYRPTSQDMLGASEGLPNFIGSVILNCARIETHFVRFHISLVAGLLQKDGQFPSFATIALDQSKQYASLLGKEYSSEFHKAIGLAAHGVGIGSYVYMRRIFERLIQDRFDEFKGVQGWSDEDFRQMKMAERIQHLKGHLPDFLVRNTRLYSIMSRGIHELDEETCLAFFSVLKGAIIIILEEDKKKKEDLARQAQYERDITAFTAPKPVPGEELTLANLEASFRAAGDKK